MMLTGRKGRVKKIRKCFREGTDCIRKSVEAKHKWGKAEEDISSKNGNIVFLLLFAFITKFVIQNLNEQ